MINIFKKNNTLEQWGIITTCVEKDAAQKTIQSLGLEIFEVRQLNFFELLQYKALYNSWIVMFKATKKDFRKACKMLKVNILFERR